MKINKENDQLLQAAKEKIKFRKYRKWYYSAFVTLAAIVIFCTTYMLVMPALTLEAEQTQVDEVIAQIEALPSYEELSNTLAAYDEAEDYESYDKYLAEIQLQVSDVYAAYSALMEKQQAAVTNADKLLELAKAFKLGDTASEGEKADGSSASLAYIDAFSISKVIDGSDPLDKTGEIVNGSVDTPGNDNGKENRVVRSFDSIEYDMQITLGIRDEAVTLPSVRF